MDNMCSISERKVIIYCHPNIRVSYYLNFSDSLSISSRDNKVHTETDDGSEGPKAEVSLVFSMGMMYFVIQSLYD